MGSPVQVLFLVCVAVSALSPENFAYAASSPARPEIVLARNKPTCESLLAEAEATKPAWIKWASQAGGLIVGGANDVLLTLTAGALQLIPGGLAKWLPLFNEVANVTSTATGKRWIYSGVRKRIIDGIALGAIVGGAIHAGVVAGPLVGALNLAVSAGLTYWFPNKYFHSIMQAVPKKLPAALRARAESRVGQGMIGISMIIILEQLLDHAQHLVQLVPGFFVQTHTPGRTVASGVAVSISPRQALALFLIDSALGDTEDEVSRAAELFWLAGLSTDGALFTANPALPRPGSASVTALTSKLGEPAFGLLLEADELASLNARVHELGVQ